MMRDFEVRRLSYSDLRNQSEQFLAKYHPSRMIPVPIEEIIEFQFEIDIVPIPNLLRSEEIDGCLSNDLKTIYVDGNIYTNYENRYRFSLAHELSHRLLHAHLFELLKFQSITEWKTVILGISEDDRGWFEWQAYALAGLILVPFQELASNFRGVLDLMKSHGMTLQNAPEAASDRIAEYLARKYAVSTAVMHKRLDYDKCWENS